MLGQITKTGGTNARTGGIFVPSVIQLKYALSRDLGHAYIPGKIICAPDRHSRYKASIVHSKLDYCNSPYYNLPKSHIHRVSKK